MYLYVYQVISVLNLKSIFITSTDNSEVKFKKETVCISYNISKTLLTIAVLEFPPSESCSRRVSLEFLYGMWVLFPSTRAEMTLPRVERDRLILVASFSLCPVAPVLACLSEPCNIWMVNELSKTFFYLFDVVVYYMFILMWKVVSFHLSCFLNTASEFFIKIVFM